MLLLFCSCGLKNAPYVRKDKEYGIGKNCEKKVQAFLCAKVSRALRF